MYPMAVMAHSWLRWAGLIVLVLRSLLALAALVRSSGYTAFDKRATTLATALVDTQLLLGLVLYVFLSPVTHAAFADPGAAMKNSALRQVFVEHPFLMLLGVALVHGGGVMAKRAKGDGRKHTIVLVAMALGLAAFVLGLPR